jgi:DNA-binding CsgD family transcriptional regulator
MRAYCAHSVVNTRSSLTYVEIADKCTISPRTAETHRTNLMRKLDLMSSADITLYAVQCGLIDPEQG